MEISKTTEYFMKECVKNKDKNRYELHYRALKEELLFWERYDHIYNSNRKDIFEHLYFKPQYFDDAEKKKCRDLNISESTLERYRKSFIKMFLFIVSQLKKESGEESSQQIK